MTRSPLILVALALSFALGGCGSRSFGNKIDDQFIPSEVSDKIAKANPDLAVGSHIVVTSYNGVVLLAGQTPRSELKGMAEQAARSVQGVRKVHNELQVIQPSSALARSNDALLTTKIKTQMLTDNSISSSRIKVITENGIVYLLGLVSRQEATNASNLVQGVSGVQKIVKLFEYIN
ncbi:BON domain-containing protein [Pseudomonas cavernicola]|uniref:BON domain-containing protein n=1 Tax=Pseudomonas cavernicola TaxID=2320866 RepID=A0A418XHB6_9PSED|nr:BON domain-containing protein [Pseudomonas cavernicola]RJG11864.1 BON domain-containing protein [Pseudomonas cavernicola]